MVVREKPAGANDALAARSALDAIFGPSPRHRPWQERKKPGFKSEYDSNPGGRRDFSTYLDCAGTGAVAGSGNLAKAAATAMSMACFS